MFCAGADDTSRQKYNPDYTDGQVVQDYLPERLEGRTFLGPNDLGDKIDPEVAELDEQTKFAEELDHGEELLLNPDGD
jgi:putative ATPase